MTVDLKLGAIIPFYMNKENLIKLAQSFKNNMDKETLIKLSQPAATLVLALCVLSIPSRIYFPYFPDQLDVFVNGGSIDVQNF